MLVLVGADTMSLEEKIMQLELQGHQMDELLTALNTTVYRQQKRIDELEALCQQLAQRLREVAQMQGQKIIDERPPHY